MFFLRPLRSICLLLGGMILLTGLLFGRSGMSYLRTSAKNVRESVADKVPIEFEIKRARDLLEALGPDIEANLRVVAKAEASLAALEQQTDQVKARLAKLKEDVLRLKSDLTGDATTFVYAGKRYERTEVQADLARRFERFKAGEEILEQLQKVREARKHNLQAAQHTVENMMAARRQLNVEIEGLQARMQMLAAVEAKGEFDLRDTQLAQVRELVNNLRQRVDVAERLVAAQGELHDEIPLDTVAPEDITDQVAAYFNENDAGVLVADSTQ